MGVRCRRCLLNNGPGVWLSFAVLVTAASSAFAQSPYSNKLAPYVSSPQRAVDRMLEMAAVKPGELVYDLGCGDGRVLITAVQKFKAKAVGIEISDKLVRRASERVASLGLQNQAKVVKGDLRQVDFSNADVVVMYLLTDSNEEIRPRLEKLLKPGARVVSYSYAVPGWKPVRVDKTDEHYGHSIFLYEMPPTPQK
jgi:predicted RNA methylase